MDYVKIDWENFINRTVLDVGCAYGIWSVKAAQAGAYPMAMDIRSKWLEPFYIHCTDYDRSLPFIMYDFTNGWILKHDIVLMMAVLHHMPKWEKAMDLAFQSAQESIYFDVAITTDNPKSAGFKKRRKPWSWVPTELEFLDEVNKRAGVVEYCTYGNRNGCDRAFLKVKV